MDELVKLSVDVDGPLRGIRAVREQALPFTIVRALTMTAQDAQRTLQGVERFVFHLRNDWTTRNTKITPAQKTNLMAEVYTDTSNWKTGAPDYLPRQQDGGEHVPLSGHLYVPVPTNYLYKYTARNRPIPDALQASALLPLDAELGASYSGAFSSGKGTAKRVLGKRSLKRLGSGQFVAFTQIVRSGTLCLFVRHESHDAEPWYLLKSEVAVRAIFPMAQITEQVVETNFGRNFTRAAAEVAVNDMLRGTGLSVKF